MRLLLLALLVLAFPAHAGTWTYTNGGWPSSPYTASSPEALCSIVANEGAQLNAAGNPPTYGPVAYSGLQTVYFSGVEPERVNQCLWTFNWANGTTSGVTLAIVESATSSGSCVAGEKQTVNVTMGWARSGTPNAPDTVGTMLMSPGDSINAGGCALGRPYEIVDCYRSAEPSPNGLYRVSCDYQFTKTGSTGATASAPADPATPNMACAGAVGEVNGRKVCVGTASNPLPPPVGAQPSGQNTGNPAAGPKPSSGPGAGEGGVGRTPVSGEGGNAGGGSSAAIPPGGNAYGNGGTGTVEVDLETCGLPGKPACKIDESGTPDGSSLGGKLAQITAAGDALKGAVEGVEKPSSLGWSFGIAIPASSCSSLQFYKPGGTWGVDICNSAAIDLMRALLAWFMAVVTALYVWRRVTEAAGNE